MCGYTANHGIDSDDTERGRKPMRLSHFEGDRIETVGGRTFDLQKVLAVRQDRAGVTLPDVWAAVDGAGREVAVRQVGNGTWTTGAGVTE